MSGGASRRAVHVAAAAAELGAAVRRIARDEPAAAQALRVAARRAAERIGAHPPIGVERPDYAAPPYRFLPLTGFPCILIYNAATTPPRILHVVHGARDLPGLLTGLRG